MDTLLEGASRDWEIVWNLLVIKLRNLRIAYANYSKTLVRAQENIPDKRIVWDINYTDIDAWYSVDILYIDVFVSLSV